MKKRFKTLVCVLLILLVFLNGCTHKIALTKPMSDDITGTAAGIKKLAGVDNDASLLSRKDTFPAGSSVCDWTAFAFAISGVEEDYNTYLCSLADYVEIAMCEKGCLDKTKATEYHRIAMTVFALGGDPTAFSKDAYGKPVDLIELGTYNFDGELGGQGLNGYIFALITLDIGNFAIPENAKYTRRDIVNAILESCEPEGGFGLEKGAFDVDITAMAIQALSPYYGSQNAISIGVSPGEIASAVDRSIERLASVMTDNCTFVSYGSENVESTAQTIIALCSLGKNPTKEEMFKRGGRTIVDGMQSFLLPGNIYRHSTENFDGNLMSSEQAMLAQIALYKLNNGLGRLYSIQLGEG